MEPHEIYTNGDGGSGSDSEGEADGRTETRGRTAWAESIQDATWPARALAALNALRKSRQHYDVLLAGDEGEAAAIPAHRAVLAALSPRLLAELPAPAPVAPPSEEDAPVLHVGGVASSALGDLVEFAYSGRVAVRDAASARALHVAARKLRVEALRQQVGALLLRRVKPADCLQLRALPGLDSSLRRQLDVYIAEHLEDIVSAGALGPLPLLRVVMLRESSAVDGEETPDLVAAAALAWIRIQMRRGAVDLESACAQEHLLYVDEWGALQDCELIGTDPVGNGPSGEGGEQNSGGEWAVIAARRLGGRATQALLVLGGSLVAAHVAWRGGNAAGVGMTRGGPLPPCAGAGAGEMTRGRCAHGIASLPDRLIVLGGYDRAEALKSVEEYSPEEGRWRSVQNMPGARARFAAARLGDSIYCVGGSDGHSELASVVALKDGKGWEVKKPLPSGRSHAGAAADETRVYVAGGWAGGHSLREVLAYTPGGEVWEVLPSLGTGRSQAAAVVWAKALWVLGGCDAWRCLATTEMLALDGVAAWVPGPALPTARRSVGGAVWQGRLVAAGGSDGSSSLRRTEFLTDPTSEWAPGPPLRQARAAPGLAALRGALYCVGGYSGQQFLGGAEVLYNLEGPWTELIDAGPARSVSKLQELTPAEEKREKVVAVADK